MMKAAASSSSSSAGATSSIHVPASSPDVPLPPTHIADGEGVVVPVTGNESNIHGISPHNTMDGSNYKSEPSIPSSGFVASAVANNTIIPTSGSTSGVIEREERGKKSVAYRHTEFHRLMVDHTGKEYERRMCNYCDGVFSFKGGTTSAALRHLKSAHPERILYSGLNLPLPPSRVAEYAATAMAASEDDDDDEDYQPEDEEQDEGDSTEKASKLSTKKTVRQARKSTHKRKREDGAASGAATPTAHVQYHRSPFSGLTASQIAITHFLHHHKEKLSVSARLRFVKHLTHNISEAEMYNVLDEVTRVAYIKEFADEATSASFTPSAV